MKKARYEYSQYYEAIECDCGGIYINQVGITMLMTSPPQKTFACNKCSKQKTLYENDWPQFKAIIGKKIESDAKQPTKN